MLLLQGQAQSDEHENDQVLQHVVAERPLELRDEQAPESAEGFRNRPGFHFSCFYMLAFHGNYI